MPREASEWMNVISCASQRSSRASSEVQLTVGSSKFHAVARYDLSPVSARIASATICNALESLYTLDATLMSEPPFLNPTMTTGDLPSLGESYGALELGTLFSTMLYGVVVVQCYNYYQARFKDGWILCMLVSIL